MGNVTGVCQNLSFHFLNNSLILSETLHSDRLPENLYIADATLLPKAMGNPPMLTIMALAKKIAGNIREK